MIRPGQLLTSKEKKKKKKKEQAIKNNSSEKMLILPFFLTVKIKHPCKQNKQTVLKNGNKT